MHTQLIQMLHKLNKLTGLNKKVEKIQLKKSN